MKVIIAGSRDFSDFSFLVSECDKILHPWDVYSTEIVSGTAKGADQLGEQYAVLRGFTVKKFPANWDFGKQAGYLRNKEMAEYADMLIAFWNGESKGTKHMIDLAKEQGLSVKIVTFKSTNMSDYPRKGLNQGTFQVYEYQETEKAKFMVMFFTIKGKEFRSYVFEPRDYFWEYGKKITDADKVKEYQKKVRDMIAAPVVAIIGKERVDEATNGITKFKDFCKTLEGIVPANRTVLDLFLQYSYRPRDGQDRTYLELPNTPDSGMWCVKHEGDFKQQINEPYDNKTPNALTYVNHEGMEHAFVRDGWFLQSNYWNPQGVTVKEKPASPKPPVPTPQMKDVDDPLINDFDDSLPF